MLRLARVFVVASTEALLLAAASLGGSPFVAVAHAQANFVFTAPSAPPPLPVYSQPALPGPGYLWIPGYWAWNGQTYYWTPGYWMLPPAAGLLWTPAYWAWNAADGDYVFRSGYWAKTVGFYGGINYGFGYTGDGYQGGYWKNDQFYYNRAVNDLGNFHVASYANQVLAPVTHVSYNGGRGGATVRPSPSQVAMEHERHVAPTGEQILHRDAASRIPTQRYDENKGAPPIPATARASDISHASTALPWPHSVAGARAPQNGPFVRRPVAEPGRPEAKQAPNGPVSATGSIPNFAEHPVTIRGPATSHETGTTGGASGGSGRP
jgi:WXXGXW repeat (2 copies)